MSADLVIRPHESIKGWNVIYVPENPQNHIGIIAHFDEFDNTYILVMTWPHPAPSSNDPMQVTVAHLTFEGAKDLARKFAQLEWRPF